MPNSDFYYSAEGKKIFLKPSDDTLIIAYKNKVSSKNLEKLIRQDDRLKKLVATPELVKRNIVLYKRNAQAKLLLEAFIERITQSELVAYACPIYYLNDNPRIVTDEFIAAFKHPVSLPTINELNGANHVEILAKFDFVPNTFLLRHSAPGQRGALDMANLYYETNLVEYAEPNFIEVLKLEIPFIPNDPLFPQQWHLTRIAAPEAWEITKGSRSIIVAVIDDAVAVDHIDFNNGSADKVTAGIDVISGDNDPRPSIATENHGTAVAGVAVAEGNNNEGVSGSAPGCRLMGIRFINAPSVAAQANAFTFAANNGAAVINNSYGQSTPISALVLAAVNHALANGRGGKGCVILFAAGNQNGLVASNNQFAIITGVIAVAASNDQNVRSGYSNFGPEVSIDASSDGTSGVNKNTIWVPNLGGNFQEDGSILAIFTTDRMGSAGINPPAVGSDPAGAATNYTGTFGGTSSACPLAAGVAALILSANPDLTRQQVKYIMEATADKIDFSNTNPIGRYLANGHSQWYGFGRVNAFNAVKGTRSSVAERDFVQKIQVTLRRTSGSRFVSTKVIRAIDARQRRAATPTADFVRSGGDGFLHTKLGAEFLSLTAEIEVDE